MFGWILSLLLSHRDPVRNARSFTERTAQAQIKTWEERNIMRKLVSPELYKSDIAKETELAEKAAKTKLEEVQKVLGRPSFWPVGIGFMFFLLFWWLAALIFDLTFIWTRYVRSSDALERFRFWHSIVTAPGDGPVSPTAAVFPVKKSDLDDECRSEKIRWNNLLKQHYRVT